ncbi:YHYH domain-containing protein [Brevibacillus sp. SYSU BS000544]|uniref:YHYH domain-containing protein n=1 Tax=Brevibacillus sp. SYSU BS000544 TaxID=3416443 RepID=UPI003CE4B8E6
MNKILSAVLTLALIFVPIVSADAHSGRTDSSGGHNCSDKSKAKGLCTGYHYHNGGHSSGSVSAPVSAPVSKPKPTTPAAPVVQKKTIVAVEKANVFASPYDSTPSTTLWYGYEINDLGSIYDGFVSIDKGYVSRSLLTQYIVIKPKTVKVQADKGYLLSIPVNTASARGFAAKNSVVYVVGENNGFYYGSTKDASGKVLVGFISKTVAY